MCRTTRRFFFVLSFFYVPVNVFLLDSGSGSVWRTRVVAWTRRTVSDRICIAREKWAKMNYDRNEIVSKHFYRICRNMLDVYMWVRRARIIPFTVTTKNACKFRTIKLKKEEEGERRMTKWREGQSIVWSFFFFVFFVIALMVGLVDVARRRSLCVCLRCHYPNMFSIYGEKFEVPTNCRCGNDDCEWWLMVILCLKI